MKYLSFLYQRNRKFIILLFIFPKLLLSKLKPSLFSFRFPYFKHRKVIGSLSFKTRECYYYTYNYTQITQSKLRLCSAADVRLWAKTAHNLFILTSWPTVDEIKFVLGLSQTITYQGSSSCIWRTQILFNTSNQRIYYICNNEEQNQRG